MEQTFCFSVSGGLQEALQSLIHLSKVNVPRVLGLLVIVDVREEAHLKDLFTHRLRATDCPLGDGGFLLGVKEPEQSGV